MKKDILHTESHIQIIHFVGGYKRTIKDIVMVWENEMTHLVTKGGVEWIINKKNVLCVEKLINPKFKNELFNNSDIIEE